MMQGPGTLVFVLGSILHQSYPKGIIFSLGVGVGLISITFKSGLFKKKKGETEK